MDQDAEDEDSLLPASPTNVNDEMMNYARNPRKRPQILNKLLSALKTIPPSSIEAERAFSTCGIYATKLRTKLNDDSLDALIFLNKYYKKERKNKPNCEKISQLDKTFQPDKKTLKSTSGKTKQPEIKTAIKKAQAKAVKKRNDASTTRVNKRNEASTTRVNKRRESQEFDPDETQMVGDLNHIFNLD